MQIHLSSRRYDDDKRGVRRKSNEQERRVDALALRADERRDKLR